jgi:hypothetical protein
MQVKLFWKQSPVKFGAFKSKDANAISLENEINAWLREHRHIKIADIRQSATGGGFGPMLWSISVWYEEGDS